MTYYFVLTNRAIKGLKEIANVDARALDDSVSVSFIRNRTLISHKRYTAAEILSPIEAESLAQII